MPINLKPVNVYQEFEPYDVDVDNRPLLDIQNNIQEIVGLLENSGFYSEIAADPSQLPAGGFSTFTCACIGTNSLLIPIDISKSIIEIDYTTLPIVLILGYNIDTNTYQCLSFSAGITLTSKFASFVSGSQGRLLKVGPGGVLVDQMYYDLAYASSGYQSLYVGKILGPNSIVFGGNQVSILGNNFYLAKNRDDSTSGLITVQRANSTSNTVFKSVNINDVGSSYNYAEYVNSYGAISSNSYSVPIYFSSSELDFDQSTGLFLAPVLEAQLNEIHFLTPSITTFTGASQTYLTAGINVRSLLDFTSLNLIHTSTYSNSISELTQDISTKLIFQDRVSSTPVPIGLQFNNTPITVGDKILASTNQPANLLPITDTTGITIADYFNTAGGYIGGVQDNSALTTTRNTVSQDQLIQSNANFTTNGINDYSNSFTLLISAKSNTSIPSNIALSSDGYINLSSGNGILTNQKNPVLDAELTSKKYVDTQVLSIASSANTKVPLTGTTNKDASGNISTAPITGKLDFDVTNSQISTSQVLVFNSINTADILSANPINVFQSDGTDYQIVKVGNTAWNTSNSVLTNLQGIREAVSKDFLYSYYEQVSSTGAFVQTSPANPTIPQNITGQITITGAPGDTGVQLELENVLSDSVNLRLTTTTGSPVDFTMDNSALTISSPLAPVLLTRASVNTDAALSIPTKGYVDAAVASVTAATVTPFYAIWNQKNAPGSLITVGSITYSCAFATSGTDAGADTQTNLSSLFTPGAGGLLYKASNAHPIVLQINAGASWYQQVGPGGGNQQWRTSCNILVNTTIVASSEEQFSGSLSARPTSSVSSIVVLNPGDTLVVGAKVNSDLTGTNAIDQYLSMARIG